jgi:hypothetical protein
LQNIQLSKNPPSRPRCRFGVAGPRDFRRITRRFRRPPPEVLANGVSRRPATAFSGFALPSVRLRERFGEGKGLVENTGLEPVTSWLQTRRSPS